MTQKTLICFFLFTVFLMIGCTGPRISITEDTVYETPLPQTTFEYYLGPGDVVEIIYHFENRPSQQEYTFSVGDVLLVEFFYHPEMNKQVIIRPDGMITLPLKGDINAGGLTPTQLKSKIALLFADMFKDPVVTVTLIEFDQAINRLREAITTATRGQSKTTTIRPDGYVSFPLIGDIRAAGLTLPRLRDIVVSEYSKVVDRLSISVNLAEIRSNLVYVLGEVKKPDYYLMMGPTTLTQILSQAGGFLDTAEKCSVLVLSRNHDRKPVGKIVNLDEVIGKGNIGQDLLLKQFDVVFVPKSRIAKADLFVDQYINQIIPRMFRASINYGYDLNDD